MFPRHGRIETLNFAFGIPLNIFLLYLIKRFSRKELGAYKHLLTIFVIHDIFLLILEVLVCAAAFRIGSLISVVSRTFWESRHIICVYVAFYSIPFCLTNINFLYRYWAIKSPEKLSRYSNRSFQIAFIAFAAMAAASWYLVLFFFGDGDVNEPSTILLREDYKEKFNLTITDGWVSLEYWRDDRLVLRSFLVLVFTDMVLLTSFTTATTLSTMTFYHIQVNTLMSERHRKTQRTVLIALCAQAIVPLLCVYLPYANVLNAPFFGVDDIISSEITASFVSAFPLWDATVIILLMKDYRQGVISIVFGDDRKGKETTSQMFTTRIHSHP